MYVDRQGMIDRHGERELVQLTDRETPKTGAIVDQVLQKALADAAEDVHGYAAGRYQVPFALPAPDKVARWQADIALYLLYRGAAPDKVKALYDVAKSELKDLARGTLTLQVAGVDVSAPADNQTVLFEAAPRIMTGRALEGF
ncbi:gp436 family protein [Solidesulfovibrio sp.]